MTCNMTGCMCVKEEHLEHEGAALTASLDNMQHDRLRVR